MGGGGKKGGGETTIGYRYFMGVHAGLCVGELDQIITIRIGDKLAWEGDISANTEIYINKPDLFGGEEREGGIQGSLAVLMGGDNQPQHSRLAAMLGGIVPAFRGVASTFFDGMICAMSPYPKPWAYRVRRSVKGWNNGEDAWYKERAMIPMANGAVHAMNPAHILYQIYTDTKLANPLPTARIDDAAFRAAADTLYNEGFGLCLKWVQQDSVQSFEQVVLNHIGASVYTSRQTGLRVLKLIRDDYTLESLPLFTWDTGLLGIDDDETSSFASAINEIIVHYRDPVEKKERQVRVKNVAAILRAGGANVESVDYFGVPTAAFAARLGQRDLQTKGGFIRRFTVRLDRRGRLIYPGHAFRISDPSRGIENMILRAGRCSYGAGIEAEIKIEALQDVFGLPTSAYVDFDPPSYTKPDTTAKPITDALLIEASYRDLAGNLSAADIEALTSMSAYLLSIASAPSGLSLSYELKTSPSGSAYKECGTVAFTPSALIASDIDQTARGMTLTAGFWLDAVKVGAAALLGNEIVRIDAINLTTSSITLSRGCADTLPSPHAAGAKIWFYEGFSGKDSAEYQKNMAVYAKLLTLAPSGKLAEAAAPTARLYFTGRAANPYPPANVRINDTYWPVAVEGDIHIDFAHRNRRVQADQLLDFFSAGVTPEVGTSYICRLQQEDTGYWFYNTGSVDAHFTIQTDYVGSVKLELWTVFEGNKSATFTHTFMHTAPELPLMPDGG